MQMLSRMNQRHRDRRRRRILFSEASSSADIEVPVPVQQEPMEVEIVAKYDFGWNKRGNGFSYDSHSGHGSLIGNLSNKVLGFGTKSKVCAMCSHGHPPEDHDCRKNWTGTSKAMEAATAVDLILKNRALDEAAVRVGTIIGDADSSTTAALTRESIRPIKKLLDVNHNLKSVSKALWKAKAKHKFLSAHTITYLKQCISYAVAQNRGDVEGTRKGIRNVVKHTFGEHQDCGDWCKAKDNANYSFKFLPNNVPFSDLTWRTDFEEIVENQASHADQLAPGGSSQQNESFNHMVATRAPKSRHYAGTAANALRVAAAVSYKNSGATHLENVFKNATLSPTSKGLPTRTPYRELVQRRRETKQAYQSRVDVKRRRLRLKMKTSWDEAKTTQREGISYVSGMGNTMTRAATAAAINNWLPTQPPLEPECVAVIVDTETTGLDRSAQVVQIAAKCGDRVFSEYMVPSCPFSTQASEKTRMKVVDGTLYLREEPVKTLDPEAVAHAFIDFLGSCGPQVVLVGHNIVRFDAPRIVQFLQPYKLHIDLCGLVYGLCDTIPLIKQGNIRKQDVLAQTFLTTPEWTKTIQEAHNAEADCNILEGLLQHFNISREKIIDATLPIRAFFERQDALLKKRRNLPTLEPLKQHMSTMMLGKMASSGVTINELRHEYQLHGRLGLEVCLGVQLNGKPRVTKSQKVIDKIEEFFKNPQE